MKKNKKKELLELLETLEQANDMVGKKHSYDINQVINILTQCQDAAVNIGNCLESNWKNANAAVKILEEYSENLYQMSLVIYDKPQCKKLSKKIQKELYDIKNFIQFELPSEKKEVVFFPYKASMWDSMESIWKAAVKDERCETFVIPIPYYDRNPDGSLETMHDERKLYPGYVKIVSWEEYEIQDHKPDIAYIHNPYEEYNYVTTVHPLFYARELKKYVDCLVYVPYYFSNQEIPETHLALPVYTYSDLVIVQNRIAKRQLENSTGKKHFYDLGSPKLDRLLSCEKANKIPDRLRQYEGKKIILLNTSINAFLQYNEQAIKKMESVLEQMSIHKELIVVWRPHPLLEATMKSMRPDLLQEFLALKERFLKGNYGIFDTEMDLDELVTCADAYIGEISSSIVVLFASLGKPIYILEFFSEKGGGTYQEAFFDFNINENEIWFANSAYNAICSGSWDTGLITGFDIIEDEPFYMERGFTCIQQVGDTLYFAPMNGRHILSFNMKTKQQKRIGLRKPQHSNFNKILAKDKDLFFIPATYHAIIKYNTETEEVTEITKPVAKLKHYARETGLVSMFASCMVENKLYIASPTSNYVVEYQTDTEKVETYKVGVEECGYWDLIFDGTDFWLNPYKGKKIIRWNKEKKEVKEYDQYPENFSQLEKDQDYFIQLADCGSFILAFPKSANMIIQLDKETGAMSEYLIDLPYKEGARLNGSYQWESQYYFVKKDANCVYALSAYDHSLLIIDNKTGGCKRKPFVLFSAAKDRFYDKTFLLASDDDLEHFVYRESRFTPLHAFLDRIVRDQIKPDPKQRALFLKNLANSNGTAGEKIHNLVMEKSDARY